MLTIDDIELKGKRVLLREDLNVPLDEAGNITSDARIIRALPSIQLLLAKGAKIIITSHLGRPQEGEFDEKYSLKPVCDYLASKLDLPIKLVKDWQNGVDFDSSSLVVLENIRFSKGEKKNSPELARALAEICDVFVMDAFATAHRKQASTYGVAEYAKSAVMGPLLHAEISALSTAFEDPQQPVLAIIGGSKVSTKLELIANIIDKVDNLILGGGIANTFLKALGHEVGNSLFEADMVVTAENYLVKAKLQGCNILLPTDVVVAQEISDNAKTQTKALTNINAADMILDIGAQTIAAYAETISAMRTIIFNGPVGVFEKKPFANGTKKLAQAIAQSSAFSVAGGGDTVAALEQFGCEDKISYISTGGGAFLEMLQGVKLPAVAILEEKK